MTQDSRFQGIKELYGLEGFRRISQAHVCVLGLGGVGSWVVESLARSGIGQLTLIDGDAACVSNINRQLHALNNTIGLQKTAILAERIRQISPTCQLQTVDRYLTPDNLEEVLPANIDVIVDAIDSVSSKSALIAHAKKEKIPIIVCGGAAGQKDPSLIRVADLSRSKMDPLLRMVRRKLRTEFRFPKNPKRTFGIPCVFSEELAIPSMSCANENQTTDYDLFGNTEAKTKNCEIGYGSACHITGAFGLFATSVVLKMITQPPAPQETPSQSSPS